MNVVATKETRRALERMLEAAKGDGAGEAVLRHLREVDPPQLPALVTLLVRGAVRSTPGTRGRPSLPFHLTPDQQRNGYTQYRQGSRTDFAITAAREYMRANKRAERARKTAS